MLHGYCIRFRSDPLPADELRGVGGALVQCVLAGDLALWISETDGAPTVVERLREHERVVRSALLTATPLPLRYGTHFRDAAHAAELLGAREIEYLRMLERFAGRVEMGVRVSFPAGTATPAPSTPEPLPPARPTTGPGRAHLEERRSTLASRSAVERGLGHLLDSVEADLADLDLPTSRSIVYAAEPFGSLAQLVRREGVSAYRERVARIERRRVDVRVVATGPWAPYSFVT